MDFSFTMTSSEPLQELVNYRYHTWHKHCNYLLDKFLVPYFQQGLYKTSPKNKRSIVLVENRINKQWLFTALHALLMCPSQTAICFVCDNESYQNANQFLAEHKIQLEAIWLSVENLSPDLNLSNLSDFNILLKNSVFWNSLPHEHLLVFQTDSLLIEPLPEFFFQFPYLGAPFLPRQQSEYFQRRDLNGNISGFFKVDTPIHGSPHVDVYPHLHGNGGLSIRHRELMSKICEEFGLSSLSEEQEDVFFSRHISKYCQPPPLQIAKAFACESTYQQNSIGSHAAWKYFTSSELAEHLDRQFRQVLSMTCL